jgi:microcystin-dependent protein
MDPFIGEIRVVGFNFAPQGWATCDGQILSIAQNTALFSLLGTQYGGNGTTNFALPDFRSRASMGHFQGPGLSDRVIGEEDGHESVTLASGGLPSHAHGYSYSSITATTNDPTAGAFAAPAASDPRMQNLFGTSATSSLANDAMLPAGGGQPHNNLQPYTCLNFIIALQGIFPARQ